MTAPQASVFNTKDTKLAKSTSPFASFVLFVFKDGACGASPLSVRGGIGGTA